MSRHHPTISACWAAHVTMSGISVRLLEQGTRQSLFWWLYRGGNAAPVSLYTQTFLMWPISWKTNAGNVSLILGTPSHAHRVSPRSLKETILPFPSEFHHPCNFSSFPQRLSQFHCNSSFQPSIHRLYLVLGKEKSLNGSCASSPSSCQCKNKQEG